MIKCRWCDWCCDETVIHKKSPYDRLHDHLEHQHPLQLAEVRRQLARWDKENGF